jgi:membrane-associated protease RseP (regulator of RpoE activity)
MGARAALAAVLLAALVALVLVAIVPTVRGESAAPGALAELRSQLQEERQAREALETKLARVESDLAALREERGAIDEASAAASVGATPGAAAPDADEAARIAEDADPAPGHAWFDVRRLAAAGLTERDVGELKRVFDEIELERLYLQNQASRERWPEKRLNAEMAALGDRLTELRTTYGDETYDWFLYASNRPNRVVVEGVLGGSAAEDAGIRAGDVIVSYDRERVFRPGPLVQGTLRGNLEDHVDVEIWRQGERIELTIPRGPLGVRLGRKTSPPDPVRQ